MKKQKKDGKSLNCILDRKVYDQLELYCNEVGQTKTLAVERILNQYFTDYYNSNSDQKFGSAVK